MDLDKYFKKAELIPAIVTDIDTGAVLMLAYMNKESLKLTLETGSGAVQEKNTGTRALHRAICRR